MAEPRQEPWLDQPRVWPSQNGMDRFGHCNTSNLMRDETCIFCDETMSIFVERINAIVIVMNVDDAMTQLRDIVDASTNVKRS